ncbi:MAG TPA: hypothetical protein VJ695_08355, partial [Nitrososphaera sp.]|nr:hypothetical protein [Nitrososphaera sp.]
MIGKKHGKATKPGYEITKNNKSQATTGVSAVEALVIVGVLVSGLFLIGSYPQSVLSQEQNMLGEGSGARNTITSANDTTTDSIVLGRNMTNATNDSGGSAAAGGNQSQIRLHLQEALSALRNNDTQGALMHLDIVLNTIGGGVQGNTTTTT